MDSWTAFVASCVMTFDFWCLSLLDWSITSHLLSELLKIKYCGQHVRNNAYWGGIENVAFGCIIPWNFFSSCARGICLTAVIPMAGVTIPLPHYPCRHLPQPMDTPRRVNKASTPASWYKCWLWNWGGHPTHSSLLFSNLSPHYSSFFPAPTVCSHTETCS